MRKQETEIEKKKSDKDALSLKGDTDVSHDVGMDQWRGRQKRRPVPDWTPDHGVFRDVRDDHWLDLALAHVSPPMSQCQRFCIARRFGSHVKSRVYYILMHMYINADYSHGEYSTTAVFCVGAHPEPGSIPDTSILNTIVFWIGHSRYKLMVYYIICVLNTT